jgi:hypothetical protein
MAVIGAAYAIRSINQTRNGRIYRVTTTIKNQALENARQNLARGLLI